MKKFALLMMLSAAVVFSVTACGGKKTENVQTEAAAAAQSSDSKPAGGPAADAIQESRPSTVVELPEEYDQEFFEGVVTGYTGNVITVSGDAGSKNFDISRVEQSSEAPVLRGCYVEVSYADTAENDVYPADGVGILNDNEQQAEADGCDPVLYGTLQYMDANEMSVIDDAGRTIEFDPAICRTVSFSEIKTGEQISVTYAGSINTENDGETEGIFGSTPFAIKLVAADSANTEDAQANYVEGIIDSIDGSDFVLSTAITNLDCSTSEAALNGFGEEDKVKAYYTGSLSDIVVSVEKIEKF